jgi:hypothetical protein
MTWSRRQKKGVILKDQRGDHEPYIERVVSHRILTAVSRIFAWRHVNISNRVTTQQFLGFSLGAM